MCRYVGQTIRKPLDDVRQRQYDAAGQADYMFAVDDEVVVDATLTVGWEERPYLAKGQGLLGVIVGSR